MDGQPASGPMGLTHRRFRPASRIRRFQNAMCSVRRFLRYSCALRIRCSSSAIGGEANPAGRRREEH